MQDGWVFPDEESPNSPEFLAWGEEDDDEWEDG